MTEITPNDIGFPPSSLLKEKAKDLYGHPPGLWVLTVTEGWLSFSLYGMISLLVLYMSKAIFIDHQAISTILGLKPLLTLVQTLYIPANIEAVAGGVMGLFLALLFILPLFGSLLADHVLGRTRTTILGLVLMMLGDVLLCFHSCFVLALAALLLGAGCAGSMKSQVGALYKGEDRRRSDAYQIYTIGVQVAVIISPILCATMNEFFPWKGGFLVAAAGMTVGLLCYIGGGRYLPDEPVHAKTISKEKKGLTSLERKRSWLLLGLVAVFALAALPNAELNDGYVLWASQHYRLTFFGYHFPVSYLMSLDGFISTITALMVLWGIQFYEKHLGVLQELTKISFGCFITVFGPVCLILGEFLSPGPNQISLWWGVAFHTVNDIGYALVYAIGMALFSRLAPPRLNTLFISLFVLHLFFCNLLVGKLSTLLDHIPNSVFWGIHAGAVLLAFFLFIACIFLFPRLLREAEKA